MNGTFLTGDIFNFYVFFELALVASYVLALYGRSPRVLGAGLVFTAVNLLGTFVFLLSIASLYRVTGTLDMTRIAERMAVADPNAAILIAVGFFVAFSVKLGLFPFHFWLPTVYTAARPAVAAILSGSLANIGAYGLLRFGGDLLPRELELAAGALIVIGAASIMYGGVLAVSRRTGGEMLAYSAIGQVGYVLVAIGIGGPVGFAAAILYTIVNATEQDDAVPDDPDARRRRRWPLCARRPEHRRRPASGRVRRQARGLPGRRRRAGPVAVALLGSLLSIVYAFQIYQFEHWRPAPAPTPGARCVATMSFRSRSAGDPRPRSLAGTAPALSDAAAAVLAGSAMTALLLRIAGSRRSTCSCSRALRPGTSWSAVLLASVLVVAAGSGGRGGHAAGMGTMARRCRADDRHHRLGDRARHGAGRPFLPGRHGQPGIRRDPPWGPLSARRRAVGRVDRRGA